MTTPIAVAAPLQGLQLIEASAGTGKTWTISGLYLRLIVEQGLAVDQVLTITFTRAATAELRERVRSRLQSLALALDGAASDDPVDLHLLDTVEADTARLRVQAALRNFDACAIYTIHGFCQRALADRALSSGIAFGTEIVPDVGDWLREIVADYWRRHIAVDTGDAADAGFVDWLLRLGHSPETLQAALRGLLGKPPYEVIEGETPQAAFDALREHWRLASEQWPQQRADIERFFDTAKLARKTYQPRYLGGRLDKMDRWFDDGSPFNPCDALPYFTRSRLLEAGLGEQDCPPLFDTLDALQADIAQCEQAYAARWRRLRLALLAEVRRELPRRMQAEHRQGYDDLLRQLHQALEGPHGATLAAALRERYPAALIDEFQDTDGTQWGILRRLYAEAPQRCAFLVGDPKQAIYSFRGADIYAYLAAVAECTARHELDRNFRSTPGLVAALNERYAAQQNPFQHASIRYQPVAAAARLDPLVEDGEADAAPLRLVLAEGKRNKDAARDWAADMLAGEIARLLAGAAEGRIRLGARALAAGDLAVLVNTHRQALRVREALRARGIASAEQSNDSVFASEEAEQLERVLLAIAMPQDESLVRAALASAPMGADAARLAQLETDDSAWAQTLDDFQRWHQLWRERGLMRMLREWQRDAGVVARLAAHADGERRLTNLFHLAEMLHAQAQETPGMDALLDALAAMRREGRSEAAELRLESDAGLVQILTIHRSKGLEYPICFLPFLWDASTRAGSDDLVLYHDPERPQQLYLDAGSPDAERAISLAQQEELAERQRVAYVALTRAKHRCYVYAGELPGIELSALHGLLDGAGAPHAAPDRLRAETPQAPWAGTIEPDAEAAALQAAPLRRPPPMAQVQTSFTALLRQIDTEHADHDELSAPPATAGPGPASAIAHRFARGAQTGVCLHAILERIDFADAGGWPAIIDGELRKAGFDPAETPALARWIEQIVSAPLLDSGCTLAGLPQALQRRELEFLLPLKHTEPAAITRLLRAHGWSVSTLAGDRLSGFLKGFIDLTFQDPATGRWWIADYKSNALGTDDDAYTDGAIDAAMRHSDYPLQALLYLLALHRWLRSRDPGYDYERDIGGGVYLFLRGMSADAPGRGITRLRPSPALIEALDRLFEGRRG